ncbi:Biotin-protein ligase [Colletotrichum chlorophyti]|uniref:Biotin-protein ligase n=1 Tax=Colletotrichum chlorophyti TaxID=708187 RepID=A0A1Q8S979_9PEZI|nr:Biotin-protein ligase [Colletotrichum chlorophyti]
MVSRKLNVLVYTGTGTTVESVRHCIFSLRRLLSPTYAVIPVAEAALLKEPWQPTCALLAIPGGGDLGYCRVLNGPGNRRIAEYVRRGGAYLGFCAGGYYGSRRCEFEVGDRTLEVIGTRELGFFPGTCRGGAFKGFEYHSEKGARAVRLSVKEGFADEEVLSYYNGGGVFVDAEKYEGVEVLAQYADDIAVDGGDGRAAVIYCRVGSGGVILTGPHPEFAAANLNPQPQIPSYESLVSALAAADAPRAAFLRACLSKLGLDVSADPAAPPSLSRMHLTSVTHSSVAETLHSWEEAISREDGEEYIRGEHDVFRIEKASSRWGVDEMREALPGREGIIDYDGAVKVIVPHEEAWPDVKETPSFNHRLFYTSLQRYRESERFAETWGDTLMYGEVVTSTNTLMDKNPKLLACLPTGFTLTATTQVAGRGRGTNVWVSPAGCLIFSTVINHPAHLAASHPVVFIQYIAAIAIVEAVKSYDTGCEDVPVKLKWPNDIYCRDPNTPATDPPAYVKIGGILSNCAYSQGSYQIVLGIGINTTNTRPTTSLNAIAPASLAGGFHLETLLARILTRTEALYAQFRREGFSRDLEERYYKHWLHSGQKVTLETEAGAKAKVVGITRDWGMLKAVEVDALGRETGRMWALQSDENSFDFWRGLVKRKL